jgi:hypothetical protein
MYGRTSIANEKDNEDDQQYRHNKDELTVLPVLDCRHDIGKNAFGAAGSGAEPVVSASEEGRSPRLLVCRGSPSLQRSKPRQGCPRNYRNDDRLGSGHEFSERDPLLFVPFRYSLGLA